MMSRREHREVAFAELADLPTGYRAAVDAWVKR